MKGTKNKNKSKDCSRAKTQQVENKENVSVYGPYGYGVNSLRNYGNRICITSKPLYVGD